MRRNFLIPMMCLMATFSMISCSDDDEETTVTPEEPEVITYEIGDLYSVDGITGIVYKLDETKTSGMIVSMTEPEEMIKWSKSTLFWPEAYSETDGQYNRDQVLAYVEAEEDYTLEDAPLFSWCETTFNIGDISGWYVPSLQELTELYYVVSGTEGFTDKVIANGADAFHTEEGSWYWASTDYESIKLTAFVINFYNGNEMYGYGKLNTAYARAVRAF